MAAHCSPAIAEPCDEKKVAPKMNYTLAFRTTIPEQASITLIANGHHFVVTVFVRNDENSEPTMKIAINNLKDYSFQSPSSLDQVLPHFKPIFGLSDEHALHLLRRIVDTTILICIRNDERHNAESLRLDSQQSAIEAQEKNLPALVSEYTVLEKRYSMLTADKIKEINFIWDKFKKEFEFDLNRFMTQ